MDIQSTYLSLTSSLGVREEQSARSSTSGDSIRSIQSQLNLTTRICSSSTGSSTGFTMNTHEVSGHSTTNTSRLYFYESWSTCCAHLECTTRISCANTFHANSLLLGANEDRDINTTDGSTANRNITLTCRLNSLTIKLECTCSKIIATSNIQL